MSKRRLPALLLLVFIIADVACLVFGKAGSWLAGFGARGLVFDFLFGVYVLVQYLRED